VTISQAEPTARNARGTADVLVVGGGIAGLAAALRLAEAGRRVTLVEASNRLGGKIGTETADGFVVEAGPDSFITTRPAAARLCVELGLGDELVGTNEPRTVYVMRGGRLHRLPDGLALVVPTRFRPFASSPLFSPLEKLRMGLDLVLPRGRLDSDESVGSLLRRRLGGALVNRIAGPLLGGIYGTGVEELSAEAVTPQLRELERGHRSLILGSLAARRKAARSAGTPGGGSGALDSSVPRSLFLSLRPGMGSLVEALEARLHLLGVDVRLATPLLSLERSGDRWTARIAEGQSVEASAAILAVPAPAAAALLDPLAPDASAALRGIPYGSAIAVSLGYAVTQVAAMPAGHGFVVAQDDRIPISAITFSSQKWPGRAPDGFVLVRVFLRESTPDPVATAREIAARFLTVQGRPAFDRVSEWAEAMPRYTVGHLDRVRLAEDAVADLPGIHLAGAAYHGLGIPDCVGWAETVAARVLSAA
jgi:protoporphyrinogen/coproporphyrinogen III oxidase